MNNIKTRELSMEWHKKPLVYYRAYAAQGDQGKQLKTEALWELSIKSPKQQSEGTSECLKICCPENTKSITDVWTCNWAVNS